MLFSQPCRLSTQQSLPVRLGVAWMLGPLSVMLEMDRLTLIARQGRPDFVGPSDDVCLLGICGYQTVVEPICCEACQWFESGSNTNRWSTF